MSQRAQMLLKIQKFCNVNFFLYLEILIKTEVMALGIVPAQ